MNHQLPPDMLSDSRRVLDRLLSCMFCAPLRGVKEDGSPRYRDDQIKRACEIIDQVRGVHAKPSTD